MVFYCPPAPAKLPRQEGHIARTDKWLAAKYAQFNRRYFDGKLPETSVHFRGRKRGASRGFCYYAGWGKLDGITVNPYQSETEVLAVLLHEMVHAEQIVTRRGISHDRWFKARCRELTAFTKGRYGKIT